jgi:hypothetical protein
MKVTAAFLSIDFKSIPECGCVYVGNFVYMM